MPPEVATGTRYPGGGRQPTATRVRCPRPPLAVEYLLRRSLSGFRRHGRRRRI